MTSKHEFAIYLIALNKLISQSGSILSIQDPQLALRLGSVLRLKTGEQFTLFNELMHASCELLEVTKKGFQCKILAKAETISLKPKITFVLPILKKDDFELALYSLVELGANTIQLVTTQKTQRSWGGEKELERCQRIMIAAAEQSKNFSIPKLLSPISLPAYLNAIAATKIPKIYFDVDGQSTFSLIQELYAQKPQELILMIGPEGDLTPDEKQHIYQEDFKPCALTPTVLRSVSAVTVGLGIMRSILR